MPLFSSPSLWVVREDSGELVERPPHSWNATNNWLIEAYIFNRIQFSLSPVFCFLFTDTFFGYLLHTIFLYRLRHRRREGGEPVASYKYTYELFLLIFFLLPSCCKEEKKAKKKRRREGKIAWYASVIWKARQCQCLCVDGSLQRRNGSDGGRG